MRYKRTLFKHIYNQQVVMQIPRLRYFIYLWRMLREKCCKKDDFCVTRSNDL
jgi:hypothetical protein